MPIAPHPPITSPGAALAAERRLATLLKVAADDARENFLGSLLATTGQITAIVIALQEWQTQPSPAPTAPPAAST